MEPMNRSTRCHVLKETSAMPSHQGRFTVRQLMVGITFFGIMMLLEPLASRRLAAHTWWEIKPFLDLLAVPVIVIVLSRQKHSRILILLCIMLVMFLSLAWLD